MDQNRSNGGSGLRIGARIKRYRSQQHRKLDVSVVCCSSFADAHTSARKPQHQYLRSELKLLQWGNGLLYDSFSKIKTIHRVGYVRKLNTNT